MVTVNPFRGLRFDPDVIGDPGRVLVPPYDSISPDARDDFEACSAYNMVRLILDPAGRYDHAAKLLESWVDEGALRPEAAPSLYMYEQSTAPERRGGCRGEGAERSIMQAGGEAAGGRRLQRGMLASVPLDRTRFWVLPHEGTMPGPVADRLRLLNATRTNLSPIFGLYAGGGASVPLLDASTAGAPVIDCVDVGGIRHRLWPVDDPGLIAGWQGLLADRKVLIADGHHRYRAYLDYQAAWRAEHPDAPPGPADEVLMFLADADADADGPSILPMHRLLATVGAGEVVEATAELFEAAGIHGGPAEVEAALQRLPADLPAFGLHGREGSWLLTARDRAVLAAELASRLAADGPAGRRGGAGVLLDVDVLHELVLAECLGIADGDGAVRCEVDRDHAAGEVAEGRFSSLVMLRPVPFPVVLRIAGDGGILPAKTTWFSPKPRDGLVLRPLDDLGG